MNVVLGFVVGLLWPAAVSAAQPNGAAGSPLTWKQCLNRPSGWYGSIQAVQIADNVLLYQRDCGGWPKNIDMAAALSDSDKARLAHDKGREDATIDNGATCEQLRYLARVIEAGDADRFRRGFRHGIDYLLAAQYPNGGWPQFYPRAEGYSRYITFNDNAMINVMSLLRDVSHAKAPYGFVDAQRRDRARAAVERGIDCILKCQIVVDGRRLAWCAQHDDKTLKPAGARSYEKPSLSGSESVGIVDFLMRIDDPSPQIVEAVEAAVKWLDDAKLTGIREVRKPAPGTERGYDKVVVEDKDAPPLWARFYEIGTNRPIFCSRDGVVRYSLAEISYERRNGYSWYTDAPASLGDRYPKWHARWAGSRSARDTGPTQSSEAPPKK